MKRIFITSGLFFLSVALSLAQSTNGTVTFTVTTVTDNGQYSPKNIMAIWIKNSSGTFVRSMKVMAVTRIQYLYQWKVSSNLNKVDAVTGSTLSNHQTHTVSWNCTSLDGNTVPDGNYEFWVEYADNDYQGPYTHYTFTKGTSSVSLTYTDQPYFKNATLQYTPATTGIPTPVQLQAKVYRKPFSNTFVFETPSVKAENVLLRIYNLSGQLMFETQDYSTHGEVRQIIWNKPGLSYEVYVYRIENGSDTYSGKFE